MTKWLIALALLFFGGQCLSLSAENIQGVTTTALAASLSAEDTTASVATTTGFPSQGRLYVGDETIPYTGTTSSAFTGLDRGTDASDHDSGARVYSEVAGILNIGLDFRDVRSTAPVIGPLATLTNGATWFADFFMKAILWDYSFFDETILGFPLVYLKYAMYCLSIALAFVVMLAIRQLVLG